MKKIIVVLCSACALFTATNSDAAAKLKLTDLPEPVQKTIVAERGTQAEVTGITVNKKSKDGAAVYDVVFKEAGKNPKLRISADGTVIKESGKKSTELNNREVRDSAGAPARDSKKPLFNDLPPAVQSTITKEKGAADVKGLKIQRETLNKQSVFRVEFEEKGKNTKLWVNEAGAILKDNRLK